MFKGSGAVKCPAVGCQAILGRNDLKPNKELESRLTAYKRREKERERAQKERADENAEDIEDVLDDD
jgi:hypothetical protein